ncbi:MAG: fibronectin type III domain-containing protein, partial [Candidatus Nanopelagicales bacterium]
VYAQTCLVPSDASAGRYTVTFSFADVLGNSGTQQGHAFEVSGAVDQAAPVLVSVEGPSQVVAGDAVSLRWRLTDTSGVQSTSASMRGPSGAVVGSCSGGGGSRVSGDARDGVYLQSCVIPETAPTGQFSVVFQSTDVVGNTASTQGHSFDVTRGQARLPGVPTGIVATVSSSTEIRITWSAPADPGSEPILHYKVQRSRDGGTWVTYDAEITSTRVVVSNVDPTSSYSFRVAAVTSVGIGSWSVASAPVSTGPDQPEPTGVFRIGSTNASARIVAPGKNVTFRVSISVLMTDGSYEAAPNGTRGYLQTLKAGRWQEVGRVSSRDGILRASATLRESAQFRFSLDDGTVSRSVAVAVRSTSPDQVVVNWPTRVVGTFRVSAIIKQGGRRWRPRERVVLQVRSFGSTRWVDVDSGVTRRGKVKLRTKNLAAGTWRVQVPEHDLEDSRTYGSP